jgi:hypothetical protein
MKIQYVTLNADNEKCNGQDSLLEVGSSTCPQCLDSGVRPIYQFELYTDVSTNTMHDAWQAGVGVHLLTLSTLNPEH